MITTTTLEETARPFREKPPESSAEKRLSADSPLMKHLRRLGINPINRESVEKWKARKIAELRDPIGHNISYREPWLWLALPGACIMMLSAFLITTSSIRPSIPTAVGFWGGLIAICIGMMGRRVIPKPKLQCEWRTAPLDEYVNRRGSYAFSSAPKVPRQIMQRARMITEEIPNSRLVVHYLFRDPFIEVIHEPAFGRSDAQFIEFWDEGFVLPA